MVFLGFVSLDRLVDGQEAGILDEIISLGFEVFALEFLRGAKVIAVAVRASNEVVGVIDLRDAFPDLDLVAELFLAFAGEGLGEGFPFVHASPRGLQIMLLAEAIVSEDMMDRDAVPREENDASRDVTVVREFRFRILLVFQMKQNHRVIVSQTDTGD